MFIWYDIYDYNKTVLIANYKDWMLNILDKQEYDPN